MDGLPNVGPIACLDLGRHANRRKYADLRDASFFDCKSSFLERPLNSPIRHSVIVFAATAAPTRIAGRILA